MPRLWQRKLSHSSQMFHLFGLSHLINGTLMQVVFTFGIGLVFGFAKYKIRDCGYVGVAFGHGLYDFFIEIVRMLIV